MLVAFSSPVKFSKIVFSGVKFRAEFEILVLRTKKLTVGRCESLDLRFFLPKIEYQIAAKFVKCTPQKFSQIQQ